MSNLPYPKEHQKTYILKHKYFQYDSDLERWVNENLSHEQIINVSCSQNGPDCTWTIWYKEFDYKKI